MGHEKRTFFVECLNIAAAQFVRENIESGLDETKLRPAAAVEIREGGRSRIVRRDLTEIDQTGVTKLRNNQARLVLRFNLYMQESKEAKITPWKLFESKTR